MLLLLFLLIIDCLEILDGLGDAIAQVVHDGLPLEVVVLRGHGVQEAVEVGLRDHQIQEEDEAERQAEGGGETHDIAGRQVLDETASAINEKSPGPNRTFSSATSTKLKLLDAEVISCDVAYFCF